MGDRVPEDRGVVTLAPCSVVPLLTDLFRRRAAPSALRWFDQALADAWHGDRGAFLEAFTAAARHVGKAKLNLVPDEVDRLGTLGVAWPLDDWGLDDMGRVTLLLRAAGRWPEDELGALVEECCRHGDNRERGAVLRALPLLPSAERFVAVGIDACRTHIQPLFEAIACENPYPARHFPDLNFNQMVLKALFTGVALARVVQLDARVTPELGRMANDYASERRAAGRSVPPDLWRLTGEKGSEP
jgi:hypothetical protein